MRKILSVLLALACLLSCVGCSKKAQKTESIPELVVSAEQLYNLRSYIDNSPHSMVDNRDALPAAELVEGAEAILRAASDNVLAVPAMYIRANKWLHDENDISNGKERKTNFNLAEANIIEMREIWTDTVNHIYVVHSEESNLEKSYVVGHNYYVVEQPVDFKNSYYNAKTVEEDWYVENGTMFYVGATCYAGASRIAPGFFHLLSCFSSAFDVSENETDYILTGAPIVSEAIFDTDSPINITVRVDKRTLTFKEVVVSSYDWTEQVMCEVFDNSDFVREHIPEYFWDAVPSDYLWHPMASYSVDCLGDGAEEYVGNAAEEWTLFEGALDTPDTTVDKLALIQTAYNNLTSVDCVRMQAIRTYEKDLAAPENTADKGLELWYNNLTHEFIEIGAERLNNEVFNRYSKYQLKQDCIFENTAYEFKSVTQRSYESEKEDGTIELDVVNECSAGYEPVFFFNLSEIIALEPIFTQSISVDGLSYVLRSQPVIWEDGFKTDEPVVVTVQISGDTLCIEELTVRSLSWEEVVTFEHFHRANGGYEYNKDLFYGQIPVEVYSIAPQGLLTYSSPEEVPSDMGTGLLIPPIWPRFGNLFCGECKKQLDSN